MTKKEIYRAAVIAIIKDIAGNALFQKRINTGQNDWIYSLPWGHIDEFDEHPEDAMIRELKEELWMELSRGNLKLVHIIRSVRKNPWNTYISYYYEIVDYAWPLYNAEPEKCEIIDYLDYKDKSNDIAWLSIYALDRVNSWEFYSDINIEEVE